MKCHVCHYDEIASCTEVRFVIEGEAKYRPVCSFCYQWVLIRREVIEKVTATKRAGR